MQMRSDMECINRKFIVGILHMALGNVKSQILGSIFEYTAEEMSLLVATMKYDYENDVREKEKAEQSEDLTEILGEVSEMLETYGNKMAMLDKGRELTAPMDRGLEMYLYIEKVKELLAEVKSVCLSCAKELQEKGTFEVLKNYVEASSMELVKLATVVETQMDLQDELEHLETEVSQFKDKGKARIEEKTKLISTLHDRFQELKAKVAMQTRFWVKNVECAVSEVKARRDEMEENLTAEIDATQLNITNDGRTLSEISTWLMNNSAKLEAQTEYMQEKQQNDLDALRHAYSDLVHKRNEQLDALTNLIFEYKRIDKVVEDYKSAKAMKAAQEESEQKLAEAALKVQSWWRTIMVTHHIGTKANAKKKGRRSRRSHRF
uniref:Dynein regulatory complex protein 9 n=3 Tax=Mesocestoides corti TaxID=53468 RepID=A0A5K3EJW7_MESCO